MAARIWQAEDRQRTGYPAKDIGKVIKTKETTVTEDIEWLKYVETQRVGLKDIYTLNFFNCRTYSNWEFADAPGKVKP